MKKKRRTRARRKIKELILETLEPRKGLGQINKHRNKQMIMSTTVPTLPVVIGSALGLVGSVSVYRDRVRKQVLSAASMSVWQHNYTIV